jgi:hypothetical protein
MSETLERFLVRTEGGPLDGEVRVANGDGDPAGWSWPLPDRLPYGSLGAYVKDRESGLPPQPRDSGVLRGATYRWEPGGEGSRP